MDVTFHSRAVVPTALLLLVVGALGTRGALAATCPIDATDALESGGPVADVDPSAPPGTPELDIDGVHAFVLDNGITSVKGVLDVMPYHVRSHYALLERTRGQNGASPSQPGIMMYSVDGTFLLNIGTDPNHALYDVLDMAYLQGPDDGAGDGEWRFASIDFRQSPPALVDDTASDPRSTCLECHGDPADGKPPLPIWGEYLKWDDVIGDVKGQQSEQLEAGESRVLKDIERDRATHERYGALEMFDDVDFHYRPGRTFSLPGLAYGYANTVSNMEMGSAIVSGLHTRMRKSPKYRGLREEYLMASICDRSTGTGETERDRFRAVLASNGVSVAPGEMPHRKHVFEALGLDYEHEMARDKLANDPVPATDDELDYSLVNDGIYEVLNGVVLHELAKENGQLRALLRGFDVDEKYTPCNQSGWDGLKVLEYREHQLFTLKGTARQAARANYFQSGNFRYSQGIFGERGGEQVCGFIKANIGTGTVGEGSGRPVPPPRVAEPVRENVPKPAASARTLANGDAERDLSSPAGTPAFFTFDVPANASGLTFTLSGGSGEADLYVRFGERPSTRDYDCRPFLSGNDETCTVGDARQGTYHVMLDAMRSYAGATLRASYTPNGAAPDPSPAPGPVAAGGLADVCATQAPDNARTLVPGVVRCISVNGRALFNVAGADAHASVAITTRHGDGNLDITYRNGTWPDGAIHDARADGATNSECIYVEGGSRYWSYLELTGRAEGASIVVDYDATGCR